MKVKFIVGQIDWVDRWTSGLIESLTDQDCELVDSLRTSINWQIGHIIISKYYHSVLSIVGQDSSIVSDLKEEVPIKKLFENYFAGSDPTKPWDGRPRLSQLLRFRVLIDQAAKQSFGTLSEQSVNDQTKVGNPVAKSLCEALTFTFKHQMWHNGQIAMMKRIIAK